MPGPNFTHKTSYGQITLAFPTPRNLSETSPGSPNQKTYNLTSVAWIHIKITLRRCTFELPGERSRDQNVCIYPATPDRIPEQPRHVTFAGIRTNLNTKILGATNTRATKCPFPCYYLRAPKLLKLGRLSPSFFPLATTRRRNNTGSPTLGHERNVAEHL